MSNEKPIWEGMCGRHNASVKLVDGTAQPFLAGNPHMFRGYAEAIMAHAVKDLSAQRDGLRTENEVLRERLVKLEAVARKVVDQRDECIDYRETDLAMHHGRKLDEAIDTIDQVVNYEQPNGSAIGSSNAQTEG